jgi:hypothetical protein
VDAAVTYVYRIGDIYTFPQHGEQRWICTAIDEQGPIFTAWPRHPLARCVEDFIVAVGGRTWFKEKTHV